MSDPVDGLIRDLLKWIGPPGRPYHEVMDAWRTSCPQLPVWEDANDRGFIEHRHAVASKRPLESLCDPHFSLIHRRPAVDVLDRLTRGH